MLDCGRSNGPGRSGENPGVPASLPRLVIGAPQGRSGKTTISLGICAALAGRGLSIQPFKKGPDYIDPSWLSEAAGRPCRSLDGFFMPTASRLLAAFVKGAAAGLDGCPADLCLIEGNHGLYDTIDADGWGSTASVARLLKAPVLLVVNAQRLGRSAAAMVLGYKQFEPDTPIAGVVLNQVAGGRHESKLRQAIEGACGIPVLGVIPRTGAMTIPDRHLGLVPRGEDEALVPIVVACRETVERYLDLDAVLTIARSSPIPDVKNLITPHTPDHPGDLSINAVSQPTLCTIGVIRDQAFSFYYPENLEALQEAGARLVFIDALNDPEISATDALYIGGGFPEMFLSRLEANRGLLEGLRRAAVAGMPIYAECGGLMLLARAIHYNGKTAKMAGVLPFDVTMTPRPQGHGYVLAYSDYQNSYFEPGTELRGHEFHHSKIENLDPAWSVIFRLDRGNGLGEIHGCNRDGLLVHRVLAGYTHIHTAGAPEWAPALVHLAQHG